MASITSTAKFSLCYVTEKGQMLFLSIVAKKELKKVKCIYIRRINKKSITILRNGALKAFQLF